MVGTSSRTIASSGKIWGQFGQRLFWEVDVASTEWQDISGLSVYLWFSVTNAIFQIWYLLLLHLCMVSTVYNILLHTYRQFQGASAVLRKHHHAMPPAWWVWSRRFRICISAVDFFGVKNYPHVMMTWKTSYHIRSVNTSKSRKCMTYMYICIYTYIHTYL